jgi:hypothetical protein
MSHKTRPQTRPGKARPDIAWLPHLAKSSQPSGARLAAAYYRITARASVTTLAIETFEMDEPGEVAAATEKQESETLGWPW